jgi:hypothetical protein
MWLWDEPNYIPLVICPFFTGRAVPNTQALQEFLDTLGFYRKDLGKSQTSVRSFTVAHHYNSIKRTIIDTAHGRGNGTSTEVTKFIRRNH